MSKKWWDRPVIYVEQQKRCPGSELVRLQDGILTAMSRATLREGLKTAFAVLLGEKMIGNNPVFPEVGCMKLTLWALPQKQAPKGTLNLAAGH